jgi:rhamnose utilization protein RhaD (predicted bifunctional aldolase and dehydrogenase)
MVAQSRLLENRWDDARAATMDEPGKLLYRSNLLGSDKRITNYGGGNTSAKVEETDPLTGGKDALSGQAQRFERHL